jgi:hypothetical protein
MELVSGCLHILPPLIPDSTFNLSCFPGQRFRALKVRVRISFGMPIRNGLLTERKGLSGTRESFGRKRGVARQTESVRIGTPNLSSETEIVIEVRQSRQIAARITYNDARREGYSRRVVLTHRDGLFRSCKKGSPN